MSPRWATVGNAALYGPDWNVKLSLDTLEVLVESGKVPPKLLKRVIELLQEHQDEAIEAFHATMAHRFPGTLDEHEEE